MLLNDSIFIECIQSSRNESEENDYKVSPIGSSVVHLAYVTHICSSDPSYS